MGVIADDVTIEPGVHIDCADLTIGAGSHIRKGCELYGTRIVLGRQTLLDEYTVIGGGSAHMPDAELIAGDFLMTGMFSQLNIGCGLYMGDEVGIGIQVRVFTHGAWLSEYDGFPCEFAPVHIGSRVWIPEGIVCAGVTIGDDVVVAAGSVVTKDLPSGCFAAGTPARVIRENAYPAVRYDRGLILKRICEEAGTGFPRSDAVVRVDITDFNCADRTIEGPVTDDSEKVRHQLRRHGIRFRYTPTGGEYVAWES